MDPADLRLVSFSRHLRAETIPAEAVCLISERGVTVLSGSSIERIAPLLDGSRTVAQVKQELSGDMSAAQVGGLLSRLSDAGLVSYFEAEDAGRCDADAYAYWSHAGIDAGRAAAMLDSAPIEVITLGNTERDAVTAVCRASGLTVADSAQHDDTALSLVICDDYLDPGLAQINADHLASGRPWLLAKPAGTATWLGPLFQPGSVQASSGPCWTCLAKRLAGNRLGGFLARPAGNPAANPAGNPAANGTTNGNRRSPHPAALPASIAAALQLTVLEAVKWLSGFRHEGQSQLHVLDTFTMRAEYHQVTKRPQCPACGDPSLAAAQNRSPITLSRRRIEPTSNTGNGQRSLPPEAVLETYEHLVDPVTGIVAELRRDPRCPRDLHAYLSGRNRAMTESSVSVLRAGLRTQSGGKGATDIEAKVGALCEAVERYCGTRDGDELTIKDTYLGLGDKAVHPDACQLFDGRQFADRARWNATCAPFHRVPEPFNEQEVLDWTPVWSLLSNEHKLLPTALLYFNPNPGRGPVSLRADSNGNAAGSSLEDAILQGFFELVERDAVALWWYNRTCQPAVSLESFDDPWVSALPSMYRGLSRQVWVLDVTSDLGIPAMVAISRRTDKPAQDIVIGFGAHFDPRIALRRALTELGQSLTAVASVRSDGTGYAVDDPHLLSWWTSATVHNQRYLLPDPGRAPVTVDNYGYTPSQYLDIERICTVARAADLDILVLDQTRPDIRMPVAKVVVPGLRHFWPRFAPGRLYDVPVRLGRLEAPTAYEDLNPIPVYL